MDLTMLKKPFPANEIEWRLQSCGEKNGKFWGKVLAYVTNRAIQNRLDEVVGMENWKNEFKEGPQGGVICGLSIKIGDEWVTKYDGAENTDIEAVKGGLSDSMKRAAATGWGIGRYLYNLRENWADINENGLYFGKTKDNKSFRWNPPALPNWALPEGSEEALTEEVLEVEKLSKEVNDYILSGILKDDFAKKAQYYVEHKDIEGLKNVIKYCKENK